MLIVAQAGGRRDGNVRYRSRLVQDQRGSDNERWLAVSEQKVHPVPGRGENVLDNPFHRTRLLRRVGTKVEIMHSLSLSGCRILFRLALVSCSFHSSIPRNRRRM
jgi:hypothetical protein